MREFKFRVYKKETGIMYYPEATQEEYNHYFQIGSGGFWLYDREGKLLSTSNWDDVLMQFTGRKDSADVQIFEGDILQTMAKGEVYISIVRWNVCSCRFEGSYLNPDGRWLDNAVHCEAGSFSLHKVIGNIHEHPHLLNLPADSPASDTMNNFDPKEGQAEEVKANEEAQNQVAPAEQATEQESAEEGSVEG